MRKLYRLLLIAFSASMRKRWGDEMAQLAQDQLDDARSRGEPEAKILWLMVWDALRHGLGERMSRTHARRGTDGTDRPRRRTSHEGWEGMMMGNGVVSEFRAAARQISRRPASTGVAVLLLAVGIGTSAAIFSVVDAVLVRSLPLPDPGQLVRVYSVHPTYGAGNPSLPEVQDWVREGGPFAAIGAFYTTVHSVTTDGVPRRVIIGRTVGDFFAGVGVEPSIGRTYLPSEPGTAAAEVVLTDAFWRTTFGADEPVVGRTIDLDGLPVRVLGVLPPEEQVVRLGRTIDAWAPMEAPLPWMGRGTGFLTTLGRLRSDLSPETAEQPLLAMAGGLIEAGNTENGMAVRPLKEVLVGDTQSLLLAMQGASLLLMLVVAINAANVLLARSLDRSGEFAVRAALGAGRGTLARQVMVETTIAGLFGGVLGLGLALMGRDLVLDLFPELAALAGPVGLNWTLLAYTLAVALVASVFAGLWPAVKASRQAWASIKTGAGRNASLNTHGGQRAMVAVEIAATVVLIVGAGLMAQTVSKLLDVDLGFEPARVVTARLTLPEARYPDSGQRHRFWEDLVQRVGNVPGIGAAGLTSALPLSQTPDGGGFEIEGRSWDGAEAPSIDKKAVSPGYFAAMGVPIIEGRDFGSGDGDDSRLIAIVSESMAQRYFPDQSPLGQGIRLGWWGNEFVEIVGVVGDVRQRGPEQREEIAAYIPLSQTGAADATLVVQAAGDQGGITNAVRSAVLELDPEQPIYSVATMDDLVVDSIGSRRALRSLLLAVSGVALLISCIGVYGVTAQSVRGRRYEMGIRRVLGADGAGLLGATILTESRGIAVGALLGLAAAVGATRTLQAFLFEVSPLDPVTLLLSVVAVCGVALLAVLGPAWRAVATDPTCSLAANE